MLGQHLSSKSTFSLISTTQPLSCCGCAPMLLWQSGCFRLFFVFSPVWLSPFPSPSPALFPVFLSVGMGVVSAAADWHICLSSAHQPLAILPRSLHYSGVRFVPSCMLIIQCARSKYFVFLTLFLSSCLCLTRLQNFKCLSALLPAHPVS